MNYKTQSIITIGIVFAIMISIGVLVGTMNDNSITGAVTKCECQKNSDCNDNNPCTEDICMYAESCSAAKCIHKEIPNCK